MDYIFYRVYTYYKKKDHIPIMMGIYFLFVVELTILFFLGIVLNFSTAGLFSNQGMKKDTFWTIFTGIVILLFAFNVFRYVNRGRVESIKKRFESSLLNQKIKTWQIFIVPILVIVSSVSLIILLS
jgi:hypothetical protein